MLDVPSETESFLLKDANGSLKIHKMTTQGSAIDLLRMNTAKWGGEVQEELSQLFQKAIETKRELLKDVLHQCSNIILLFYDAYGYGDIEEMQQAFLNVQGYEWLHSIFIALSFSNVSNILYPNSPGRKGVFLYSKNKCGKKEELKRGEAPGENSPESPFKKGRARGISIRIPGTGLP